MQSLVEGLLRHSQIVLEQQWWLGVILAVFVNALCLSFAVRLSRSYAAAVLALRQYLHVDTFD